MNATSQDIAEMLEGQSSFGLTMAVNKQPGNLFIGREPSSPNNCVTVFDTMGFPPPLSLDSLGYELPSVQIRVRNTSYKAGFAMSHQIMTFLHGTAQLGWNGTLYSVIYCASGPSFLDWDDNNNARFVTNFNIQRRLL